MESSQAKRRYHDLDFVRAAAMLLGLLLHVCIFFMPPHQYFWGSGEYHGDVLNLQFLSFIHLFRMQLFFLLAGFFAELVIDRKGLSHFIGDRSKRILLPFVVGIVLMIPLFTLLIGNGGYYRNTYDEMSVVAIVKNTLFFGLFNPDGPIRDGLIHYWFVYYLLIFYVAHLLLRPLLVSRLLRSVTCWDKAIAFVTDRWWGFLILGVLIFPLQYLLKSIFLPPSGFNVPLADLVLYFVFYLFGGALYLKREHLGSLTRNAWYYAAFSVPLFILVNQPTERIDLSASVVTDITTWTIFDLESRSFAMPQIWYEGIVHNGWGKFVVVLARTTLCWSMCFAAIGLASRYLSQERVYIRYLADSAYWVYWVHLPITFKLSYLAQSIEGLNSVTKCYLVLVLSTLLIYATYQWFVRYTWLGDFFMGRRKLKSDPLEANFRLSVMVPKLTGPLVGLGLFFFFVGSLLHYNGSFEKSPALVEAFVTRNESTLGRFESLDGITDVFGNTPLHASQFAPESFRRYDPLPTLIEKSSSLDVQNDFGRTALFYAVKNGNEGDLEALLTAGADINLADQYGHGPAHVAAILTGHRNPKTAKKYLDILRTLIERKADLSLRDYRGRTVGDCLREFGGVDLESTLGPPIDDGGS
jgi:glucan biosynthesis protein C